MSDNPIAAVIDNAQVVNNVEEKPENKGRGSDHGGWSLGEDCPIEPLGVYHEYYYYLDALGQLRSLKSNEHSKLGIVGLFHNRSAWLHEKFPRTNKAGETNGWDQGLASEAIMAAAANEGVLDVNQRVRGAGSWSDDDGNLLMHCGGEIVTEETVYQPGKINRYIYPSAPEKPSPALGVVDRSGSHEVLDLLKTWNWVRPELDPVLLLGWIGAAMLGGALKWRPMVWITGDKSTGKSTLHDVLKCVMGPEGLISASDASAAGLWQSVGHASLPVALDEMESEEDNRKNANIIKLARHAASGGSTLRGGSDHKGQAFTVRNCFLFSSILIPPMLGQDVSRMAILQLDELSGVTAPKIDQKALRLIGDGFRRRLLNGWKRLPDTLEMYRQMLAKAGHGGRSADLFGTLMACYDLLIGDTLPCTDELDQWQELFERENFAEAQEDLPDHQRCLEHLLTSQVDIYRNGTKRSVASWIRQAAGIDQKRTDKVAAQDALASLGMKICSKEYNNKKLLVANSHQGLVQLFKETHWSGKAGTSGVWVQAVRRIEGSHAHGCIRFDGIGSRCTSVPLSSIFTEEQKGK